MDFFSQQETARRRTGQLLLILVLAVLAVVAATDLVLLVASALFLADGMAPSLLAAQMRTMPAEFHEVVASLVVVAILLSALRRLFVLRGGGAAVARMVGARKLERGADDLAERRLLNVVDEMAIASGVAVPGVWVMDGEAAINAFAAGYSPNEAVIAVTRGALSKLTRDELQAVVGHEFSHILNGDMRLNVRLIGILAGIVVIGEAGLFFIRLGLESGEKEGIVAIVVGALVAAVGYVGVLCGRVIRAAVSRQREFLADASAVQFTRNPDGLVGALRKIASDGSTVGNGSAGEMSHMYFGEAVSPWLFADWLATHPPLAARIARLTGAGAPADAAGAPPRHDLPAGAADVWPDADAAIAGFGAGAGGSGGEALTRSVLTTVGKPTPAHVDYAARLLAALPPAVRHALTSAEGSRSVIYAWLFAAETEIRARQVRALAEGGDGSLLADVDALAGMLRGLGPAARLPVVELALPSLRAMEATARQRFVGVVAALIEADDEVTLDEFVIHTIVERQLAPAAGKPEKVEFSGLDALQPEAALLLSTLAIAGQFDAERRRAAYARGAAQLGLAGTGASLAGVDTAAVSRALGRLRRLPPLAKPDLLKACVATALDDDVLRVAEGELLRAIGLALDCPLPPLVAAGGTA